MNPFEAYIEALTATSIATLRHFNLDTALAAGMAPQRARAWAGMQDTYFGATKFTRKQALAAQKARGFSLDELALIERRINGVKDAGERWRLRLALLDVTGGYRAIEHAARELVPADTTPPANTAKFSKPRGGKSTLQLTYDHRRIADIEHAGRQGIDPARPAAEQIADNLINHFFGDGAIPEAAPRPIVMVPIDDHARILAGGGDDVTLTLTDGTTMTGAEYLAAEFGEALEVAAFHPGAGAVNLYRADRFANQKQRDLASMVSPACAFPGCRHGAYGCEMHHVHPWKHGGATNLDNLTPLCRYHNRVNDDPRTTKRGRIEMIRGAPWWVSPHGHRVKNTDRGALDQLFG